MQQHIFRPIQFLDKNQPANKKERLEIIIANLETHHQDVRSSIVQEALGKLQVLQTSATPTNDMEIDDRPESDNNIFNANMNAPYIEGSGDPCVPTTGFVPLPGPHIHQAPVPPEVMIVNELIEQLDGYDKQAKQTRQYYVDALERQKRLRGENEALPVREGRTHIDTNRDPRKRSVG